MSNRLGRTALLLLGFVVTTGLIAHSGTVSAPNVGERSGGQSRFDDAVADTSGTSQCDLARESSDAAKAAATAADEEKALTLDQKAIESFEICRKTETQGSNAELNDAGAELDAQLDAAAYFWKHSDDDRAQTLMESARVLLIELCFRKRVPVTSSYWASTFGGAAWFNKYGPEIGVPKFGACPSVHLPTPTPTP